LFTGLIQDIGHFERIDRGNGGARLTIATALDLKSGKIGDSIAVDGICLTVTRLSGRSFTVDVSPETLQRTTLKEAKEGQPVNLELPVKMSDPLGGHLVSGHVDGTGEIAAIEKEGNSLRYSFRVPREVGRYLIEKGSIAVDGISLTVVDLEEERFSVSLIPLTAQKTTLGQKKPGDRVNLENDLIAKYVEKFLRQKEEVPRKSPIDAAFLAQHGFGK